MKWLTIIGTVLSGLLYVARWYLSPEQTKIRALKNDKKGQNRYIDKMVQAFYLERSGKDSTDALTSARKFWCGRVQENNRLKR